MKDVRPIIGITMGDPAGVGPEIIAKAFDGGALLERCRPVVFGDAGTIRQACGFIGCSDEIRSITNVGDAVFAPGVIDVFDLRNVEVSQLRLGEVSAMAGRAAFEAIKAAIEHALDGRVDAVVTAPINKAALHLAGHDFPGHTEIFAHFAGTDDYAMMLAEGDLRVVHVSTHISMRQACDAVSRDRILKVIRLAHDACKGLGIAKPRIGVAALNPHAGDNGLFGDEEQQHIAPAIEAALAEGMIVEGPVPADALYPKALGGGYDIAVAMYHDQGHIPLKLLGFKYNATRGGWTDVRGINITLGLPIVRASVDHGTAFDQAGKGTASDTSLLHAIDYAARMSKHIKRL